MIDILAVSLNTNITLCTSNHKRKQKCKDSLYSRYFIELMIEEMCMSAWHQLTVTVYLNGQMV